MSTVRPARREDATQIGAVHVAAWRSAYAGILPDWTLTALSPARHAAQYDHLVRRGHILHVAVAEESVVGFVTASTRPRQPFAGSEIETLYVLDDYRDQGFGRALMRAAAESLAAAGAADTFLWVLSENPSRWFYERLGGQRVAEGEVRVGGVALAQTAYLWAPLTRMLAPEA